MNTSIFARFPSWSRGGIALRSSAFAAILCAALHAHAAQDIYFNENTSGSSSNRYLNQSSNWYTDAARTQQFEGTLSSDYNGIINATSQIFASCVSSLSLNSLTYNITEAKDYNGYFASLADNASITLAEDFNVNITFTPETGWIAQSIRMFHNGLISVGGDFNITFDKNGSGSSGFLEFAIRNDDSSSAMTNRFQVAGDFNYTAVESGSRLRFTTRIGQFSVGGTMDIGNMLWTISNPSSSEGANISLGGLAGNSGMITLGSGMASTMTFTNSSLSEVKTTIGYTGDETTLNVTMRASDAQNGRQILRVSAGAYGATDANLGDAIVDSGRLDLGMNSGITGKYLSLSGINGVFSATASDSGNIGAATFESGEWYAGKIAVDIEGELAYDKIVFNGRFDKTGSDRDMGFEFTFDEYAMRDFISAGGGEFILEDVITYETGSTMAGTVFDGNTGGIRWEAVFGDTSLSVTFTVPEPATAAAVLGAIALAFAAYRRRK